MSSINSERRERYRKVAQELTFGDDTFMAAVFEYRPDIAEHIIQMLTENHELRLISSCGQYDIHSIRNRSIRLDALAADTAGNLYNIEIQRRSKGAEPERARYHSALIDSAALKKSQDFTELPDASVIFITENDVLDGGRPLYHIDRTVREKDHALFGDRCHIIYAVMKNADESRLGSFLRDFLVKEASLISDPRMAECMNYFKQNQKGETEMCEIMEKLAKEYAADEKWEMRKADVLRMLNNGFDKKTIMLALGLTDAEFESLITPEAS